MFHICFCANEAYIKYTAVLISSIIKSTDTSREFSDFFASTNASISKNLSDGKQRERERESNSSIDSATSTICHTGALAEISQLQIHNRDISVSAKPQYDKDSVIASEDKPERGNLVGLLAIQGDCHESACADSRNDIKEFSCHTEALAEVFQHSRNRDISVASLPQYDNVNSPSLAEGARGWVKIPKQTHLDSFAKRNFAHLSESEKKEGYIFHILSDFVSEDSRARLEKLAKDLSQIYPCEIQIHICSDELFSGLPKLNGNYLTYFRFFIPRFLPSECKICLYLDIDMLVLGDLRGLFTLDLQDKSVGIVKDYLLSNAMKKRPALLPKTPDFAPITFSGTHFNAGFMLINLSAWQGQNITQKCFSVMANYHLDMHDQDTLNAVITESNRLKLPFSFNLLPRAFLQSICNDESTHFKFDYTRKEMNFALKNPVILHFTSGIQKSWQNPRIYNTKGQNISTLWWDIALQTPEFSEILQGDFEALKQNPHKIFESNASIYLLSFTRSFVGFLRLPFVVAKIFSAFERGILDLPNFKNLDSSDNLTASNAHDLDKLDSSKNLSPSEYNFAFDLFLLAQKSWKRRKKGDLLILPFRAIKLKFRHKKYGIIKIKAN